MQIQTAWLRGGYPEPILSLEAHFYDTWMSNYRDTYINRDIWNMHYYRTRG